MRCWMREILSLNGKPTIFQMRRFCEMIAQRGGAPPDPESLRIEYQRRLDEAIASVRSRFAGERRPPTTTCCLGRGPC